MKKIFFMACALVAMSALCSCGSSKTSEASYYAMETTCIGSELDGSITLRAWGDGNSKKDAVEQALKQAVYDVIFSNNIKGTTGIDARPLIVEANAKEKYQNYFNAFFTDGGEYLNYVSQKDEKSNSKQVLENRNSYRDGITVRVLRSALKAKLQQDGIIK